jgi:hypothetical protein
MKSWTRAAVAALALVPLAACDEDEKEPAVLPIRAAVTVDQVMGDPALYFAPSDLDTRSDDDIVVLDLMLRMSLAREFDAFSVRVRFDPGVVLFAAYRQTPEADGQTFNPFGECNSGATYCAKYPPPPPGDPNPAPGTTGPLCQPQSVSPVYPPEDHLISVAARDSSACDSYTQGGTIRLLSLTFIAATVGTTRVELVSEEPHDCEILMTLDPIPGVQCLDGNATITASR